MMTTHDVIPYNHGEAHRRGVSLSGDSGECIAEVRMAMRRIPLDRDAIMLFASKATSILRRKGFEIVRKDYLSFFSHVLRAPRWIEPYCSRMPLGAEYMVLGRKAEGRS